jgi:hypothetical protein
VLRVQAGEPVIIETKVCSLPMLTKEARVIVRRKSNEGAAPSRVLTYLKPFGQLEIEAESLDASVIPDWIGANELGRLVPLDPERGTPTSLLADLAGARALGVREGSLTGIKTSISSDAEILTMAGELLACREEHSGSAVTSDVLAEIAATTPAFWRAVNVAEQTRHTVGAVIVSAADKRSGDEVARDMDFAGNGALGRLLRHYFGAGEPATLLRGVTDLRAYKVELSLDPPVKRTRTRRGTPAAEGGL